MLFRSAVRRHTATSHALFFLLSYFTIRLPRLLYVWRSHTLVLGSPRKNTEGVKRKGAERRRRRRRSAVSTVKYINNPRPTSIAVDESKGNRVSRLSCRRETRVEDAPSKTRPLFNALSKRDSYVSTLLSSPRKPSLLRPSVFPHRRLMDTSE